MADANVRGNSASEVSHPDPRTTRNAFPINRLAVLASGSGTTFEAIAHAMQSGEVPAKYLLLVTNNPAAGVLQRAEKLGVERVIFDLQAYETPEQHDQVLAAALAEHRIGLVLLAGYLRKIGPDVLAAYQNRILNTHPALLPDDPTQRIYGGAGMYGVRVHQAVWEAKERQSGATVHLVDEIWDHGRILRRSSVDIANCQNAEEVAELVQTSEKGLVVTVLRDVLRGSLSLD